MKSLSDLKKHFSIEEFVSPAVYQRFKEDAWRFFDPRLIETMAFIRKQLASPITINNWKWGGVYTQRGLRENISPIVSSKTTEGKLYLSAHVLGMAVDFEVKGMAAEEVRKWLSDNSELLPHPVRLEHKKDGKPIHWIHLDVATTGDKGKVYMFDV